MLLISRIYVFKVNLHVEPIVKSIENELIIEYLPKLLTVFKNLQKKKFL